MPLESSSSIGATKTPQMSPVNPDESEEEKLANQIIICDKHPALDRGPDLDPFLCPEVHAPVFYHGHALVLDCDYGFESWRFCCVHRSLALGHDPVPLYRRGADGHRDHLVSAGHLFAHCQVRS